MKITFDMAMFRKSLRTNNARYRAVSTTVTSAGEGEVLVSARKKLPHERAIRGKKQERTRIPHGRFIANLLAQQGRDPFAYAPDDEQREQEIMTRETERIITDAADRGRSQHLRLRRLLLDVAQDYAELAKKYIRDWRLKRNVQKTIRRKRYLVKQGIASSKFGDPPPPGYLTGRFYDGIRARYRRGRGAR